ncbi:MAG: bifunctional folylpolyglutamate synthase/dihydrofolate synthase, partial [Bacteroidetes bacterium]|nr:bifunctional folylpolyglutamate synthase/dihydrofolate synthase [Bacteroidota bacterium]
RSMGLHIDDAAIMEGVKNVVPLTGLKGRWQTLRERPLTICDTGHNPAGIREVVEQIRHTPHRHLHFVMGAVNDKDLSEIFKLLPKDADYYFCQAKIPRAMDANKLYRLATEAGLKGKVIHDVNNALNAAIKAAGNDDLVFVGGSTFVVAELNDL